MRAVKATMIIPVIVVVFFILVIGALLVLRKSEHPLITSLTPTSSASPLGASPMVSGFQLVVLSGTASIGRNGAKTTVTQNNSTTVQWGDVVQTDVTGLATLDYGLGTTVRLGPQSAITVGQTNTTITIQQLLGNLYVRFAKIIGVRDGFEVRTPTTLAAVRGTRFAVFLQNGVTKVADDESQIEVMKLDATGSAVIDSKMMMSPAQQITNASGAAAMKMGTQSFSTQERIWMDFNHQMDTFIDMHAPTLPATVSAQFMQLYKSNPLVSPVPLPSVSPSALSSPISFGTDMPGEGYHVQQVQTSGGSYSLSCYGKNKNSVKVITDSANESDCKDNCPVKPLDQYASANGALAALNGMYFCPADYASCSSSKNAFDTLFFNSRVRSYINSDNNVYSVIPFLVVDNSSSPRFVAHTQEWGRDTNISAGTAGNPILIQNGGYVAENYSLDDKQRNTKSNRGAFVQKGDNLYLCIVTAATVPDSGHVYEALHVDNAINIDGGGSSAMWVQGSYKFGPGRQIPTAIMFVPR